MRRYTGPGGDVDVVMVVPLASDDDDDDGIMSLT